MGKPAARVTDMHVCPMFNGPVPHVGGPLLPPGAPTVLIGGMPAAVMGNMATCTGPPDSVILGSVGVMIGGRPAARMMDMCAHGGTIVAGLPTVLIGETMPGAGIVVVIAPSGAIIASNHPSIMEAIARQQDQKSTLKKAAEAGTPFCEKCEKEKKKAVVVDEKKQGWIEVALVDADNKSVADEPFKIDLPDGSYAMGMTDENGKARIEGFEPGTCKVMFPNLDEKEWAKA